jgi:cytoskeletal protein CcmA (bactofilin family)
MDSESQDQGHELEQMTSGTRDYTTPEPVNEPLPTDDQPPKRRRVPSRRTIIILLAIVIAVGAAALAVIMIMTNKKPAPQPTPVIINTQSLDNGTLNKLTVQAAGTAETKQQLTIAPDTLFKKSVQIQGDLKSDGNVEVGGNLTVRGTTTMQGAVGINSNLAVRGSLSVTGQLTAGSLNVGSLGVTNVTASGSLNFGGHLVPTGAQPDITVSVAAGGGNATVSGNDTAGTVTINVGANPPAAGELVIVTFRSRFTATPKVQITPINASASSLRYYATRSAGFFTVDTSTAPAQNTTYVFDYLVTQ